MLNLEEINNVTEELENVTNNLKNINETNEVLENIKNKIEEYNNIINTYYEKSNKVDTELLELINKLDEIKKEYYKVSSMSEIVEEEIKNFKAKLELVQNELTLTIQSNNRKFQVIIIISIILNVLILISFFLK